MSELKKKARFKEKLKELVIRFHGNVTSTSLPTHVDATHYSPLEHVTRRHFIDHVLIALGWDLSKMNEEIIEEARTKGETTLRLDYLGLNPESRKPLMIVEAKAWEMPFVSPSKSAIKRQGDRNTNDSPAKLIANALEHLKDGKSNSPVASEWTEWLTKLQEYVVTVKNQSAYTVSRVAITSGQWLVIFIDPENTFIANNSVSDLSIEVFVESELIERSDKIYDLLARDVLVTDPPMRISPPGISAYTNATDSRRVFRALWIARQIQGAHFALHPQLNLYPAITIERVDGILLTIVDELQPCRSVPYDYSELSSHIEEIISGSDALLKNINNELGACLTPSGIESFPGFNSVPLHANLASGLQYGRGEAPQLLKSWKEPNEFLLVTGASSHFLQLRPTVESCEFHEWSACDRYHQNQGNAPIVSRSVDPAAFFITKEDHHCAHRVVHDRRDIRCQIDAFEEFLCCRACSLEPFCWKPEEIKQLPCGNNHTLTIRDKRQSKLKVARRGK